VTSVVVAAAVTVTVTAVGWLGALLVAGPTIRKLARTADTDRKMPLWFGFALLASAWAPGLVAVVILLLVEPANNNPSTAAQIVLIAFAVNILAAFSVGIFTRAKRVWRWVIYCTAKVWLRFRRGDAHTNRVITGTQPDRILHRETTELFSALAELK
jgi:hypothetical protein